MLSNQPSDEEHPHQDMVCRDCGSVEGFTTHRHETMDAVEYDTFCDQCQSDDVEDQADGIPTIIEAAEARGREAERADAARFITKEAVSATPRGGVKALALTTMAIQIELGLHVGAAERGKDQE